MIHYLEIDRGPDSLMSHTLEDGVLKKFVKRVEKKMNIESRMSEIDYKSLVKYRDMALDYKEVLRLSGNEKLNMKYRPKLNKLIKAINKLLEED